MEVQIPLEEGSDKDEALSFCDLVTEQGVEEFALRDSNTGCLDQEDFGFDFDFERCGSTTEHVFPADDLFRHGFRFPLALSECVQCSSFEKSNSENLLANRNDSVDLQSSFCSSSNSSQTKGEMLRRSNSKSKGNLDSQSSFWSISRSLQRKTNSDEISRLSRSKSKGNHHKPPGSGGKMSATWRSLTLGLTKTPPVKLEDMRLRQGKTKNNINGAKNLDLRRSVSCNYYKDPKLEEKEAKAVNFEEKCSSGKENAVVPKMPWLKGWKMLARFSSMNSCKTSSDAVVENRRLQKAC